MPAPVNDNIANAIELVGAGGTETHVITDATMEVGEPLTGLGLMQSMWFYVSAPAARTRYDLDLSGSTAFAPNYAVTVYVYEASTVPATFADLGPETWVMASDFPPPGAAFRAEAGQAYYVQVLVQVPPQTGTVVLEWAASLYPAAPPNDDFANAETIVGGSGSFAPIDVSSATVEVSDTEGFPDIWFNWTAPASGPTFLHVTGTGGDGIFGTTRYAIVYTGATLGTLAPVSLDFQGGPGNRDTVFAAVSGTTYRIVVVAAERLDGGAFPALAGLDWNQPDPPVNDDFADATDMSGSDGNAGPLVSLAATLEPPDEPDFGFEWSVWLKWDGVGGPLRVSLADISDPDNPPVIRTFTGGPTMPDLDFSDETSFPDVSIDLEPGQPWFVQVGWYTAAPQTFTVEWAHLPVPRIVEPDRYRYLLVNRADFAALMCLDRLARGRTLTRLLDQPALASGKVASDDPRVSIVDDDGDPFLEEGIRFLIVLRRAYLGEPDSPPWVPFHGGQILTLSDEADHDLATTSFTSFDPWQTLMGRPVVNADGSLIGKNGLSFTATRGDVIVTTLLDNTVTNHGDVYIDAAAGTVEATPDVDVNFQQGTSVGEAWQQLVAMGVLDIVLTPLYDPAGNPGKLAALNVYTQAGQQRNDVLFAWDRGPRTISRISRLTDGGKRANVVQFFDGQGGPPVTRQTDATSVARYGETWRQLFLPAKPGAAGAVALAEFELLLSRNGQTTVVFTPTAGRAAIPDRDYLIGDRVHVVASRRLRRLLDGYQRVYGVTQDLDEDAVTDMLTSADAVT